MLNALDEAVELGFETVQVFTKNQQQWSAKPLEAGLIKDWNARVKSLGWQGRIVSHASYLINLASPDDVLWGKSVDLMTDEIERCEALGIPFLVHHPGSFTTSSEPEGVARIAKAYKELFKRTKGFETVMCLEGTVGSGRNLGGPFEQLAAIRGAIIEATGQGKRVGYCLDTCHMHAFGYDLATKSGGEKHLAAFGAICGMENLKCFHINDSKGKPGSRLDRHEHIGLGTIGWGPIDAEEGPPEKASGAKLKKSGFAAVVNHPHVRGIPKILETPKEEAPKNKSEKKPPVKERHDWRNVGLLRGLEVD